MFFMVRFECTGGSFSFGIFFSLGWLRHWSLLLSKCSLSIGTLISPRESSSLAKRIRKKVLCESKKALIKKAKPASQYWYISWDLALNLGKIYSCDRLDCEPFISIYLFIIIIRSLSKTKPNKKKEERIFMALCALCCCCACKNVHSCKCCMW